jgi:hypothetical protein
MSAWSSRTADASTDVVRNLQRDTPAFSFAYNLFGKHVQAPMCSFCDALHDWLACPTVPSTTNC